VWALAAKDWRRFGRQPFLIVISVVMPLVFIFFYSIIVPSSATNPVVVALEGDGPAARQFLRALEDISSREGPYYEIVTTDPRQARTAFASGDAMGMVVVPQGFGPRLDAAGPAAVRLHIRNINSDYSKNLRLRLDDAVRQFSAQQAGPAVVVRERTRFPQDPTMQDYISTSLLLFACLYAGMVNTGLQVAGEWDDRTIKGLLLAPQSRGTLVAGKMVAGLGQSVLAVLLVVGVLVLAFDFSPRGSPLTMTALVAVVLLLGAGLGAAVGVASKQTLAATSVLITVSITVFLVSGNEDSLRGLAWGGGPVEWLWQLSRALPTTYAFLAARSIFLTGDATTLARDLVVVVLTAAVAVAGAALLLRRAYRGLPGGQ
jgi:ABC-type multidrug transport system permease subunit